MSTETRSTTTFCRICTKYCGLTLELADGRVVKAVGDRQHSQTQGFTCRKGRNIGTMHADPQRFRTAQRGDRKGGFSPMDTAAATAEIADRLSEIIAEHGPDSVGLFLGTQAYQATPTIPLVRAWLRAVGTHKYFRTMSIDQSAKIVAAGRLGFWEAGHQRFEDSEVWFFSGLNPIVSMLGGFNGFPVHGGRKALKQARKAGLKLLVADPRRTETAAEADHFLQLRPGTDVLLASAMLHVILAEDLHDAEFCDAHVTGLDELRAAVEPFPPSSVADEVGVSAEAIADAARCFGRARRGMATTGTGANMGPLSNLNEHLVQLLNVVCGRFPREGEPQRGAAVLAPARAGRAQVVSPTRPWENGYRSRLGFGLLEGDLPTATLPREITEPGADRVRALIVVGGNPASAIPDQAGTVAALRRLDLLVTLDPFPSETAQLSDYVIAPTMMLERPDSTRALDDWYTTPFAQYSPAVLDAPDGTVEDWRFFVDLAEQMGLSMRLGAIELEPGGERPTTDDLLDHFARHGRITPEELRSHPHGMVYPDLDAPTVRPAGEDRGRFEVLPPDVAEDLRRVAGRERPGAAGPAEALLTSRRTIGVMNTVGRRIEGFLPVPYNPCSVHPDQLAALGAEPGDLIELSTPHGRVRAVAEADSGIRPGVVSMSHCFGDLPGQDEDPRVHGTNPGRLLSLSEDVETINGMPRMTAVPVTITRVGAGLETAATRD